MLTNVLVALALTAPAVFPDSRLGRWTASEGGRAAVAMSIAVVGLIVAAIDRGLSALGKGDSSLTPS